MELRSIHDLRRERVTAARAAPAAVQWAHLERRRIQRDLPVDRVCGGRKE